MDLEVIIYAVTFFLFFILGYGLGGRKKKKKKQKWKD
jgi:hypothetical protein